MSDPVSSLFGSLTAAVEREFRQASTTSLLATGAVIVGLAAVAVEAGWTARDPSEWRAVLHRARTALIMAAGAVAVGFGYSAVIRRLWPIVGSVCPDRISGFWAGHRWVGAAAAFVVWDGVGWLYHAVGHHTAVGWAAHRPHHTGTVFDLTLGLRESWTPVHGLVVQPLAALLGFPLRTVIACSIVSNLLQLLQHTRAPVRLPTIVSAVVMTPAAHRQHHRIDLNGRNRAVNLGPVFTVWDRMAGTWAAPSYGPAAIADQAVAASSNVLQLEFAGWLELLARQRSSGAAEAV